MTIDFTWFDLALVALLAGCFVAGLRRGPVSLVAGIGAIVLWPIVNLFGLIAAPVGLLLALAGGVGLGVLARGLAHGPLHLGGNSVATALLGGAGGLLGGAALVAAITLSFPTSPNTVSGGFDYPSRRLAPWLGAAVEGSAIKRLLSDDPRAVWRGAPIVRAVLVPDQGALRTARPRR